MSDNLVRDVHDAVARSASEAEASVRPPGTTPRELRAMRRDVLRKLRLSRGASVVELGCGIGVLGIPVARRAARYVGVDFAPQAVRVANERLRTAGVGHRARAICLNVLSDDDHQLQELGRFDRVLVYAVLHYARSEEEAVRFLQRTVDLLAPAGRAVVGNVPLDDLQADWIAYHPAPRGLLARLMAAARWVMRPGAAPVPLTRRWKLRRVLETYLKGRASAEHFTAAELPSHYTLPLTFTIVERWMAAFEGVAHHWELPAPGVPLAPRRADLIIVRR